MPRLEQEDMFAGWEAEQEEKKKQYFAWYRNVILGNKKKLHENRRQFEAIFNDNLANYWDLTGFDIIKFDKSIAPGDGVSLQDALLKRYGEEATAFIENLI